MDTVHVGHHVPGLQRSRNDRRHQRMCQWELEGGSSQRCVVSFAHCLNAPSFLYDLLCRGFVGVTGVRRRPGGQDAGGEWSTHHNTNLVFFTAREDSAEHFLIQQGVGHGHDEEIEVDEIIGLAYHLYDGDLRDGSEDCNCWSRWALSPNVASFGDADFLADFVLLPVDDSIEYITAVEDDSWGRIKASLAR